MFPMLWRHTRFFAGEPPASPPASIRVGLLPDQKVEAADPEMLSALAHAGRRLETAGFQVSSAELPSCCEEAHDNHWTLVAAEASVVHGGLYRVFGDSYPPKLRALIRRGARVAAAELERVRSHRQRVRDRGRTPLR